LNIRHSNLIRHSNFVILVFMLELPHTPNCLVCGRTNPHGLHLDLHVDPDTGIVTTQLTPTRDHIGFEGIIHGGLLATVLDEAMVWAATWSGKRFCVCGEMCVRFRESAAVGEPLIVTAKIDQTRKKLITTIGEVKRATDGQLLATATGKYVPLPDARNQAFIATLVNDPQTHQSATLLRNPPLT
jgi:acyl-coenzyme A thioesterase PaaI-like protein